MKLYFIFFVFIFFSCSVKDNRQNLNVIIKNSEYLNTTQLKNNNSNTNKTIVCFWATWCKNCIQEMKYLKENKQSLIENNYTVFFISDESQNVIQNFKKNHDFDFEFLKYNGDFSDLKIHTLPTTFIYDENAKLVRKIVGVLNIETQLK